MNTDKHRLIKMGWVLILIAGNIPFAFGEIKNNP
jgi:hypothetical protein